MQCNEAILFGIGATLSTAKRFSLSCMQDLYDCYRYWHPCRRWNQMQVNLVFGIMALKSNKAQQSMPNSHYSPKQCELINKYKLEFLMTFSWLSQDYLMTSSWLSHDLLMTFSWLSHEFPLTFSWLFHRLIMAFEVLSHKFLVTFSWLSYDFLMTFSWTSHDFLMIFSGLSKDFLMNF